MVTGAGSALFVDTNILIYATVPGTPFHVPAKRASRRQRQAGVELWISRQVLREYLATLSRPQTYRRPQPMSVIVQQAQTLGQRFRIAEDGPQVTDKLFDLLTQVNIGGNQIHDANIVATMLVHGITNVLTHNISDFKHFSNLITIVTL